MSSHFEKLKHQERQKVVLTIEQADI